MSYYCPGIFALGWVGSAWLTCVVHKRVTGISAWQDMDWFLLLLLLAGPLGTEVMVLVWMMGPPE